MTLLDLPRGAGARLWQASPSRFLLVHCPGCFLPQYQQHIRILYRALLGTLNPGSFVEVSFGIGLLHWWIMQATFYKRGSAAIAEMFALALFRALHEKAEEEVCVRFVDGRCLTSRASARARVLFLFFLERGLVAQYFLFVA